MAAYERRDFAGGAVSTTLVGSVTSSSTTWTIADATGWPSGTNGPFYAVFDRGVPGEEEKVRCLSRTGTTITLSSASDRGVDGISAKAHVAPATFEHCTTAVDADEANLTVQQVLGQVTTKGDFLTGKSANRLQRTAVGTNDQLVIADSAQLGGFRWGALPTGAVSTAAQIVDATITVAKIVWGPYGRRSLVGQTPTVAAATTSVMNFDTSDYDASSIFTSTRFTVPSGFGGLWAIDACLAWPADPVNPTATNRRYIALRLNGSTIFAETSCESVGDPSGVGTSTSVTAFYRLAVTDYVEVLARQDSVGTLTFASSAVSHFAANFVRPT